MERVKKLQGFQSLKMDKTPAKAEQFWAKIRKYPDFLGIKNFPDHFTKSRDFSLTSGYPVNCEMLSTAVLQTKMLGLGLPVSECYCK